MPPFCFVASVRSYGKQRAIRANYFGKKKSASRDKIHMWKTSLRNVYSSVPVGCEFWASGNNEPDQRQYHEPEGTIWRGSGVSKDQIRQFEGELVFFVCFTNWSTLACCIAVWQLQNRWEKLIKSLLSHSQSNTWIFASKTIIYSTIF